MTLPTQIFYQSPFSESFLDYLASFKCTVVCICDENIRKLYSDALLQTLYPLLTKDLILSFPPGEEFKNRTTLEKLQDSLIQLECSSNTLILGIGGGVVLDIAGFLASTFRRGVPFISIPTSLLAMVDASVGGKNGVNIKNIKNSIGTIYFPKSIWIDVNFSQTLSKEAYLEGFAEVIKHSFIHSPELLQFLFQNKHNLLNKDPATLNILVAKNNQIKTSVVASDLDGKCRRNILNFGHTLGHALEAFYSPKVSHGHAISLGMVLETALTMEISRRSSHFMLTQLKDSLQIFDLPTSFHELYEKNFLEAHLDPEKILSFMAHDKKNSTKRNPKFVLLNDIGKPEPFDGKFCCEIQEDIIFSFLKSQGL
ncbi:3-dehydroquinate synthase [Chlamydiifrater phoenicopteri]|uniref:3-dehydroquinate synthase n=1 Tax=Chlamydiifrater phoenicopteri TaxID=2681469 RepID=UPI001BCF9914|nr:3-dehydroquinate synthase [Chlamydiifrater phoenicopteri]